MVGSNGCPGVSAEVPAALTHIDPVAAKSLRTHRRASLGITVAYAKLDRRLSVKIDKLSTKLDEIMVALLGKSDKSALPLLYSLEGGDTRLDLLGHSEVSMGCSPPIILRPVGGPPTEPEVEVSPCKSSALTPEDDNIVSHQCELFLEGATYAGVANCEGFLEDCVNDAVRRFAFGASSLLPPICSQEHMMDFGLVANAHPSCAETADNSLQFEAPDSNLCFPEMSAVLVETCASDVLPYVRQHKVDAAAVVHDALAVVRASLQKLNAGTLSNELVPADSAYFLG